MTMTTITPLWRAAALGAVLCGPAGAAPDPVDTTAVGVCSALASRNERTRHRLRCALAGTPWVGAALGTVDARAADAARTDGPPGAHIRAFVTFTNHTDDRLLTGVTYRIHFATRAGAPVYTSRRLTRTLALAGGVSSPATAYHYWVADPARTDTPYATLLPQLATLVVTLTVHTATFGDGNTIVFEEE